MVRRQLIRPGTSRGLFYHSSRTLADAAAKLRGAYASGIDRAEWWASHILAGWDTGLSTCDLLAVEREWIRPDQTMTTVRRKSGKRVTVAFSDRTMTAIDATFPPERRLIWPLSVSREMMRRTFASIAKKAGCGGTLKWLRAGSGTSVEELYGRGEAHLGNTRQVFERHYLCRSSVARLPAAVPR